MHLSCASARLCRSWIRVRAKPHGSVRQLIGSGARRTRNKSSRPSIANSTSMAFSSFSWPFRRRGSGSGSAGGGPSKPATAAAEADEEELGVTPQLLDFLRTLSPDNFKSSAHQLQGGSVEVAAGDLTVWQERHAVLVLSKAKELAKIRYDLCPRHMKDKQFWRVYFLLAKSYISPYELRAIQKEKVRRETENGKQKDMITVEVEMQESKCSRESQTLPVDSESQDS